MKGVLLYSFILLLFVSAVRPYNLEFTDFTDGITTSRTDLNISIPLKTHGFNSNGLGFLVYGDVSIECEGDTNNMTMYACTSLATCTEVVTNYVSGALCKATNIGNGLNVSCTDQVYFRITNVSGGCHIFNIKRAEPFLYILEPEVTGVSPSIAKSTDGPSLHCPQGYSQEAYIFGKFIESDGGLGPNSKEVYKHNQFHTNASTEIFPAGSVAYSDAILFQCDGAMTGYSVSIYNSLGYKGSVDIDIFTTSVEVKVDISKPAEEYVYSTNVGQMMAKDATSVLQLMPLHALRCPTSKFPCYEFADLPNGNQMNIWFAGQGDIYYRQQGDSCGDPLTKYILTWPSPELLNVTFCNDTDYIVFDGLVGSTCEYVVEPQLRAQSVDPWKDEFGRLNRIGFYGVFFPLAYDDEFAVTILNDSTLVPNGRVFSSEYFGVPSILGGPLNIEFSVALWTVDVETNLISLNRAKSTFYTIYDEYFTISEHGMYEFSPMKFIGKEDPDAVYDMVVDYQSDVTTDCYLYVSDANKSFEVEGIERQMVEFEELRAPIYINYEEGYGANIAFYRRNIEIKRVCPAMYQSYDLMRNMEFDLQVTIDLGNTLFYSVTTTALSRFFALGLFQNDYYSIVRWTAPLYDGIQCVGKTSSEITCSFLYALRDQHGYASLSATANSDPWKTKRGQDYPIYASIYQEKMPAADYERQYFGSNVKVALDKISDLSLYTSASGEHNSSSANYIWKLLPLSSSFTSFILRINSMHFQEDETLAVTVCTTNTSTCAPLQNITRATVDAVCAGGRICVFNVADFGYTKLSNKTLVAKFFGSESGYRGYLDAELIIVPELRSVATLNPPIHGGNYILFGSNFAVDGFCLFRYELLDGDSNGVHFLVARPALYHGSEAVECRIPEHPFLKKPGYFETYGSHELNEFYYGYDSVEQTITAFFLNATMYTENIFAERSSANMLKVGLLYYPDNAYDDMRLISQLKQDVFANVTYLELNDARLQVRGSCYSGDESGPAHNNPVVLDGRRFSGTLRDGSLMHEVYTVDQARERDDCAWRTQWFVSVDTSYGKQALKFHSYSDLNGIFSINNNIWDPLDLPGETSWDSQSENNLDSSYSYIRSSNVAPFGFSAEIRLNPIGKFVMRDRSKNLPFVRLVGMHISDLTSIELLDSIVNVSEIYTLGQTERLARYSDALYWGDLKTNFASASMDYGLAKVRLQNNFELEASSVIGFSPLIDNLAFFPVDVEEYVSYVSKLGELLYAHFSISKGSVSLDLPQQNISYIALNVPQSFTANSICTTAERSPTIIGFEQDFTDEIQVNMCNEVDGQYAEFEITAFPIVSEILPPNAELGGAAEDFFTFTVLGKHFVNMGKLACVFTNPFSGELLHSTPIYFNTSTIECKLPLKWPGLVQGCNYVLRVSQDGIWVERGFIDHATFCVVAPTPADSQPFYLSAVEPSSSQALYGGVLKATLADSKPGMTEDSIHMYGCVDIQSYFASVNGLEANSTENCISRCFNPFYVSTGFCVVAYFKITDVAPIPNSESGFFFNLPYGNVTANVLEGLLPSVERELDMTNYIGKIRMATFNLTSVCESSYDLCPDTGSTSPYTLTVDHLIVGTYIGANDTEISIPSVSGTVSNNEWGNNYPNEAFRTYRWSIPTDMAGWYAPSVADPVVFMTFQHVALGLNDSLWFHMPTSGNSSIVQLANTTADCTLPDARCFVCKSYLDINYNQQSGCAGSFCKRQQTALNCRHTGQFERVMDMTLSSDFLFNDAGFTLEYEVVPHIIAILNEGAFFEGGTGNLIELGANNFQLMGNLSCQFEYTATGGHLLKFESVTLSGTTLSAPLPPLNTIQSELLDYTSPYNFTIRLCEGSACSSGHVAEYTLCPAGYRYEAGISCEKCAAGTDNLFVRSVSCNPCDVGYFKNDTMDHCQSCNSVTELFRTTNGTGKLDQSSCLCKDNYYELVAAGESGVTTLPCYECPTEFSRCKRDCEASDVDFAECNWRLYSYTPGRPLPRVGYFYSQESNPLDDPYKYLLCHPKEACAGYSLEKSEQCNVGYDPEVLACGGCLDGYYRFVNKCRKCPGQGFFWLQIVLVVFFAVVSAVAFIFLRILGVNSAIMSISLQFIQISLLLLEFELNWPRMLRKLLELFSLLNLDIQIVSPECNFPFYTYFVKYIFNVLIPVYFFILLAPLGVLMTLYNTLLLLVPRKLHAIIDDQIASLVEKQGLFEILRKLKSVINKNTSWKTWTAHYDRLLNAFAIFMIISYIQMTIRSFEPFDCTAQPIDVDSFVPYYTMDSNPSIRCFTTQDEGFALTWFVLAIFGSYAFVFYNMGVPIVLAAVLLAGKKAISRDSKMFRRKFGFVYGRFKKSVYFWELLLLARRNILVFAAMFMTHRGYFQAMTALLVLFFSVALQAFFWPYTTIESNILEIFLMSCNFFMVFFGALKYVVEETNVELSTVILWLIDALIVLCAVLGMLAIVFCVIFVIIRKILIWIHEVLNAFGVEMAWLEKYLGLDLDRRKEEIVETISPALDDDNGVETMTRTVSGYSRKELNAFKSAMGYHALKGKVKEMKPTSSSNVEDDSENSDDAAGTNESSQINADWSDNDGKSGGKSNRSGSDIPGLPSEEEVDNKGNIVTMTEPFIKN